MPGAGEPPRETEPSFRRSVVFRTRAEPLSPTLLAHRDGGRERPDWLRCCVSRGTSKAPTGSDFQRKRTPREEPGLRRGVRRLLFCVSLHVEF